MTGTGASADINPVSINILVGFACKDFSLRVAHYKPIIALLSNQYFYQSEYGGYLFGPQARIANYRKGGKIISTKIGHPKVIIDV